MHSLLMHRRKNLSLTVCSFVGEVMLSTLRGTFAVGYSMSARLVLFVLERSSLRDISECVLVKRLQFCDFGWLFSSLV